MQGFNINKKMCRVLINAETVALDWLSQIVCYFWPISWPCHYIYRVAMVREKSGKLDFIQGEGVLYQVREFLNPISKSVKSQGILC